MPTRGLTVVCVMANDDAVTTDAETSSRLFTVGTGLRRDGSRAIVMSVKSREAERLPHFALDHPEQGWTLRLLPSQGSDPVVARCPLPGLMGSMPTRPTTGSATEPVLTARLVLTPVGLDDVDDLVLLYGDPQVAYWTGPVDRADQSRRGPRRWRRDGRRDGVGKWMARDRVGRFARRTRRLHPLRPGR